MLPPKPTLLNEIKDSGGSVIAIGKIEDIFAKSGVTHAIHTGSNKEGLEFTLRAVKEELDLDEIKCQGVKMQKCAENKNNSTSAPLPFTISNNECSLIFTNLVDTDMLYGHRNDAKGYGSALEEIDVYLGEIIKNLKEEDLLIVTADHGCDPTVEGTDHTREYVPAFFYHKNIIPEDLDLIIGFDYIAKIVKAWLF